MSEQTIDKIVLVFRFIKDTGIIPQGLFLNENSAYGILQKNRYIVMLILMTNFINKMVMKIYRQQVLHVMNGKYRHAPKQQWRNNYPIVLVHGYQGFGPDASYLFGNYFLYALKKNVQNNNDVYVEVTAPSSGIHDRACELY